MLPYWLLLAVPAFASLYEKPLQSSFRGERLLFTLTIAFVGVMIGLRYEVGGDWVTYLSHLTSASYLSLGEIPEAGDPGYVLLNWLVSRVGGGIWLVNLACGAVFAWGLSHFTRTQPSPWLALAVAVPYLVVVVAMGYSRQAVAIGLAMMGLTALVRSQNAVKFVLWVLLAATFHKSAVLLVPIVALTVERGRGWVALWVVIATAVGYYVLLEDSVDHLVYGYIEAEYESDGAAIRIAMNAVPAVLLLLLRRRFPMRPTENRLWIILSGLALLFVPALFVLPSTAVDRLALYMIPLQLVVLSRVPIAFARSERSQRFLNLAVVLYAAATLFVWLNYAGHADAWLPYQFYPL
jgi:hypothetical protein